MANANEPFVVSTTHGISKTAPIPKIASTSTLSLVFAILSVVFFLGLVLLRFPFPFYPLMSWQDALDLLTPLVLIPIYWLFFRTITRGEIGRAADLVFMIFAAFWAAGQGMHLAANSIDNLIGNLAKNNGIDVSGSDIFNLTYFYDENLSHYLWHIGLLGLAGLLLYTSWRSQPIEKTNWRLVAPAGILYGITLFSIFVEGLTTPLSFPVAGLFAIIPLIWGRKKISGQPVLAFFTMSFLIAFVLIAGWSIYSGMFPPPELLK